MAAASSPNNSSNPPTIHCLRNGLDPDTTFVQTDPETFRAVVQRLTGADSGERLSFNLHERRPTARKLKIKLHNDINGGGATSLHSFASNASNHRVSPVSQLEYAAERGSPATSTDEEDRAIAEKGFYFHPNPFSAPEGSDPPELLPLFPLHSPRESY